MYILVSDTNGMDTLTLAGVSILPVFLKAIDAEAVDKVISKDFAICELESISFRTKNGKILELHCDTFHLTNGT